MKTIKIIDLLNKIANGEEVQDFAIYGETFYVDKDGYIKNKYGIVEWIIYKDWLDVEVEIIEEDKDIEEVLEIDLLGQCDNWLQGKFVDTKPDIELNPYILNAINRNFELLHNKQCEIVGAINKLKNK